MTVEVKAPILQFLVSSEVRRIDASGNPIPQNEPHSKRGIKQRDLALWVSTGHGYEDQKEYMLRLVTAEEITNAIIENPTLRHPAPPHEIDADIFLQQILDHAWQAGFRPSRDDTNREMADMMQKFAEELENTKEGAYARGFEDGVRSIPAA